MTETAKKELCKSEYIPITEKAIKKYLDSCITKWREFRDCPENSDKMRDRARCYVDVYQSVRTSLFGNTLKKRNRK